MYTFPKKDLEQTKEKIKLDNRLDFIRHHLEDWQRFAMLKSNSQIAVSKIIGDVKLVTSDNPVRIFNHNGNALNIFDPANCIELPLDQEHLLWISPNDSEWERDKIYRQVRDKWFAITSNHTVAKNASEWIISKQNCVSRFLNEMKRYDALSPANLDELENIKTRATELKKFLEFAQKNGGPYSSACKQRLRELKKMPAFANDPQFQIFYNEILGGFMTNRFGN